MTDTTKLPEALRLAEQLEEEWSIDSSNAARELRRLHAENADLHAQLEAVGAGGVGAMMGGAKETVGTRWYMVNRDGMATLCMNKEDAEKEAEAAQIMWPSMGPHRAVQLVDASQAPQPQQIAEPASQWIGVNERLPVWVVRDDTPCFINGKEIPPTLFSETVLVALKGGGVRTDKLTTIEGKSEGWWHTYGERVAAWMPPPKPPTQKDPS